MRWVLRRFWPLLLLPCARAQAAGDCAGAGAAAACRCSDFSVVEVGESTSIRSSSGGALSDSCEFAHDGECDEPKLCDRGTDTSDCFSGGDVGTDGGKTMCELAGDGSGCKWEPGKAYGGICRGTCVTDEQAATGGCPTAEQCASFTTWNNKVTINGGQTKCVSAGCEWIQGQITGGSCVTMGSCAVGLNAEANALGTANQATLLLSFIVISMTVVGLYQLRTWHRLRLRKQEHDREEKRLETQEVGDNPTSGLVANAAGAVASTTAADVAAVMNNNNVAAAGDEARQCEDDEGLVDAVGHQEQNFDPSQLPEINVPFLWVKDAGFAERHASGDGFFKRTGKALSFDQMIFNVFRDWTQVMSLTLSKLSPQVPAFTSGVGIIFALTSLDFSALLKALNVDIAGAFAVSIFAIAFVLFVVFQYFWWTDKAVDKLAEGDEVVSYAKQSKFKTTFKLYTIKACHFLYLSVCNNVFQEIFNYYYSPKFDRGRTFLAFVLLIGYIICVPLATWRIISQNKPRGSSEDADYTFDMEGNKVKFTEEMYQVAMKRMKDKKDKTYNPWVDLFKGYSRTWAEYPVLVMIIKIFITMGVIFLLSAKIRQAMANIIITTMWTGILWISSPYLSSIATDLDLVSKACQFFTLIMGIGALVGCDAPDDTCSERCYADGDGYGLGVTTNVVCGLVLVFQVVTIVTAMSWCKARKRNSAGEFQFTEFNPASRQESVVSSLSASLIYDTHREKKWRVWYPVWDGIFAGFLESEDGDDVKSKDKANEEYEDKADEEGLSQTTMKAKKALGERWSDIKAQAMDAGVQRVMTWLEQEDAKILEARQKVLENMEGIDVYVDKSCFTVDEKDNCLELVDSAFGGDKIFSSKTNFAKMYITPFPLRIVVVYDDCNDIGIFYDEALPKIVALQQKPEIADKVLLRKQLRSLLMEGDSIVYCDDKGLKGTLVKFPIQRWEEKKVTKTFRNSNGQEREERVTVQVLITYECGLFSISQGKTNTMDSLKTQFDLSPGFNVRLKFSDGWGRTDKHDGAVYQDQKCSLDAEDIGLTKSFSRGTVSEHKDFTRAGAPCLKWKNVGDSKPDGGRKLVEHSGLEMALCGKKGVVEFTQEEWDALDIVYFLKIDFVKAGDSYFQPVGEDSTRKPGIDDLINDNKKHIDKYLPKLLELHQAYRNSQQEKRDAAEEVLTCRFWPEVYNKPNLSRDQVEAWLAANTRPQVSQILAEQGDALKYLFLRMSYVNSSPQKAYWFVFWDDFWTTNFKMKCLEGKDDTFGSRLGSSVIYNPMTRLQLESLLKVHNLLGSRFQRPYLFFPELLDKLYFEMERASDRPLQASVKKKMMNEKWQKQYAPPPNPAFQACAPYLAFGKNKVAPAGEGEAAVEKAKGGVVAPAGEPVDRGAVGAANESASANNAAAAPAKYGAVSEPVADLEREVLALMGQAEPSATEAGWRENPEDKPSSKESPSSLISNMPTPAQAPAELAEAEEDPYVPGAEAAAPAAEGAPAGEAHAGEAPAKLAEEKGSGDEPATESAPDEEAKPAEEAAAEFAAVLPMIDELKNGDVKGALSLVMTLPVLKLFVKIKPEMTRMALTEMLMNPAVETGNGHVDRTITTVLEAFLLAVQSVDQTQLVASLERVSNAFKKVEEAGGNFKFPEDLVKGVKNPIAILEELGSILPPSLEITYEQALCQAKELTMSHIVPGMDMHELDLLREVISDA